MATIASVDIALTANSAQLRRGLDEAERRTQRYTRRAQSAYGRLNRTIGNLQRGFLGFAAALGLANVLRTVDEVSKLSQGVTNNFEQFQRLNFVLGETGVTTQQFRRALIQVSRGVDELSEGTGTLNDAFVKLGITTSDVAGQDPTSVFNLVISRLQNIEDLTLRNAIAADIFGNRITAALGPALELVNGDLERLGESIPGTFSESQASAIERFNDSLSRVGQSLTVLVANFEPVFTTLASILERLADFTASSTGFRTALIGIAVVVGGLTAQLIGFAVRGLGFARAGVVGLTTAMSNFNTRVGYAYNLRMRDNARVAARYGFAVRDALRFHGSFNAISLVTAVRLRTVALGATVATTAMRGLGLAVAAVGGPWALLIQGAILLATIFWEEIVGALRTAANWFIRLYNAAANFINQFTDGDFIPLIEEFKDTVDETSDSIDDFAATISDATTVLETEAEPRIKQFQQTLNDLNDTAAQSDQFITNTFNGIADTITNALTGASVSIRDFVRDTLRAFISLQVRTALFNIGGSFGLGGNLPAARQFGGPVNAGQPYIVGERGPELFVPNQSGTVRRNDQLGGGGNVTYNINAVDAASFQQLVASDPSFIYNVTERGRRQQGR